MFSNNIFCKFQFHSQCFLFLMRITGVGAIIQYFLIIILIKLKLSNLIKDG